MPTDDAAATAAPPPPASRPTTPILIGFLAGHRASILAAAREPRMLLVGLIFVLSVGLAREYDGEYLWSEPWYALAPLGVSIVMAAILWIVLYAAIPATARAKTGFWRGYRATLTTYWMTAPLAWIYGIPVERWNDELSATRLNLSLLLIVSIWRVGLMTRVVSVLLGSSFLAALWPVLLFSAGATFVANLFSPSPPIAVMGGIRETATESMIAAMTAKALVTSCAAFPLLLAASVAVRNTRSLGRDVADLSIAKDGMQRGRVDAVIAIAALFGWLAAAPGPQVEQKNRFIVEQAVRAGQYDAAVRFMSERAPADFPPHWSPPPSTRELYEEAPLIPLIEATIRDSDAAPWVRKAIVGQADRVFSSWHVAWTSPFLGKLRELLERTPEGREILGRHEKLFEAMRKEAK